jgi:hypothetical protein
VDGLADVSTTPSTSERMVNQLDRSNSSTPLGVPSGSSTPVNGQETSDMASLI